MTEAMRETKENGIARKSNELIQKARYDLSVHQQKIVLYLISQIKTNDTEVSSTVFDIKDFCELCEIDYSGGNYNSLKNELEDLYKKIILKSENGQWVAAADGSLVPEIKWIEKPRITPGSRKVVLKLDQDLALLLLQIPVYTRIKLGYVLPMKSKYSIRLYEYICSIHFGDREKKKDFRWQIPLSELRERVGCETTCLDYRNFRRRILDASVKEISDLTDKDVTYEVVKNGKTVTDVIFTINQKSDAQEQKPTDKDASKDDNAAAAQKPSASSSAFDDMQKLFDDLGKKAD